MPYFLFYLFEVIVFYFLFYFVVLSHPALHVLPLFFRPVFDRLLRPDLFVACVLLTFLPLAVNKLLYWHWTKQQDGVSICVQTHFLVFLGQTSTLLSGPYIVLLTISWLRIKQVRYNVFWS